MPKKNKCLLLFFSYGYSLSRWEKNTIIDRELLTYKLIEKKGWDIKLLTYGVKESANTKYKNSFNVLSKPFPMPNFLYLIILPILFRREMMHASIFKTHQISSVKAAGYCKIFFKKPLIGRTGYLVTVPKVRLPRNPVNILKLYFWEYFFSKVSDKIILTTNEEIKYFSLKYNSGEKKNIFQIPSGINTDLFKPNINKKKSNQIIFVGRFVESKQPLLFVDIISELLDIEGIKGVMIGDGPLKKDVQEKINLNNLNISIVERVKNEELPKYFNASKLMLSPTLYEGGNPKAALESLSCGVPIVAKNSLFINKLIIDDVNGVLCNLNNAEEYKYQILKLFKNKKLYDEMSINAREIVVNKYSTKISFEKELKILNKYAN